ncbi:MAG: EAL domain-containing protein [Roseburia sp.]
MGVEYQLQYNVCAAIICVVILCMFCMQKKTKEAHNAIYMALVLCTLLAALVNIPCTLDRQDPGFMPRVLQVGLDYVHACLLNLPPVLFAFYAVTVIRGSIRNVEWYVKLLLFMPNSVFWILLAANPWTGFVFRYTEEGLYCTGILLPALYVVAIYYAIMGVGYVLLDRKHSDWRIKLSLCVYLGISCCATSLQYFFPSLLLRHLGMAVGELVVFLNLQKPDEYLESELRIYNRKVFDKIVGFNLEAGKGMTVFVLQIENLNFIIQNFGVENRTKILKQVAKFLDRISQQNTYYFNSGTFVIMQPENKKMGAYQARVRARFSQMWQLDDGDILLNYKMMQYSIPEDVKSLKDLYFCHSTFSRMTADGNHEVDVKEIDLEKAERRIKVTQILRHAIVNDYFQMYYQPIYSVEKGRMVSAEALIRLIDPEEGFIPPDEFIPIAEENGMILQIGSMILEKVFRFIKEWDIKKLGLEYIEINLSVVQCMQKELSEMILEMLKHYEIEKEMINLEITETAMVDSPTVVMHNMEELHREGVSWSLDDFGTGYSNISAMASWPLTIIKFDKTLVDMVSAHEKGGEIIRSAVNMVKKMGYKIVAEGVEQESQLEIMKQAQVDYIQGYYFSKPLPEEQFIAYIKEKNGIGE